MTTRAQDSATFSSALADELHEPSSARSWCYLASLVPVGLAIMGNLLGGWWTVSTIIFLSCMVLPDWFFKRRNVAGEDGAVPRAVLLAQVLFQSAAFGVLLFQIARGSLQGDFLRGAVFSTGLAAGAGGIVSAHELIHRRQKYLRACGVWLLFLTHFSHYYVEHLQGHHRNVGWKNDPGTARYGENFYCYMMRLIPSQFMTAMNIEATRLKQNGKNPYGLRNFAIISTVLEILFAVGLGILGGWTLTAAYFCVGAIARFFLETATYVQHYGLERSRGQPVEAIHSWESNSVVSRAIMLEIARHADHHCHSSHSYPELASHPASLELPAGYFGLFPVILIPPLWFRLAHPRIARLRD